MESNASSQTRVWNHQCHPLKVDEKVREQPDRSSRAPANRADQREGPSQLAHLKRLWQGGGTHGKEGGEEGPLHCHQPDKYEGA